MNSLSFPLSKNGLMSSSFLKDIFSGYRLLCLQFFLFSTLKILYFLLVFIVSDEKYEVIQISVPLISNASFFSGCFKKILFVFSFQLLDYDEFRNRFCCVYPLWGLLSFLMLQVYAFCQIHEVFSHYFFNISPHSFSPLGTLMAQILEFLVLSCGFLMIGFLLAPPIIFFLFIHI